MKKIMSILSASILGSALFLNSLQAAPAKRSKEISIAQDAPPVSLAKEELLKEVSSGFSRVAKKAIPAVVYIETQVTKEVSKPVARQQKKGPYENPFDYFQDEFFDRFFGSPSPYLEEPPEHKAKTVRGSGFIFSHDGYIITNNHVVENAIKVLVTLHTGKKLEAKIIGTDPKTDLAVIKIDEQNLPTLPFGNSVALEVGDWAIAVGNPFGLEATVTVGVVSAKGRNHLHITDFEDFIQTDAAINPGNSGGPLLDIDAEVIGINTAIVSGSGGYMGIGFAIPSNMTKIIVDQLIKEGSVTRGYLGVTLQPIDSDLAAFYKLDKVQGALVTDVVKDSPAEKGGVRLEDIIISYNNMPVESLSSFRNAVSLMPPGASLVLKVYRDGKPKELNMTIAHLPSEGVTTSVIHQKMGLNASNLTPELATQYGYPKDLNAVIITHVHEGTPAAEAAIQPGTLVLAVNRQKITNVDDFNTAMQAASKEGKALLMLRQGEVVRFTAINF